jgi:hypothetical protein
LILTATWCASCDLSGQHGLVLQGPLELGVGMLPLDGDAEQARKAGKEIGIRKIELARVGAVDFQKRQTADDLRRPARSGR